MAIESKMNRGPIGSRPSASVEAKKFSSLKWIAGFLLLFVIGGVWYFSQRASPSVSSDSSNQPVVIHSGEYQAVFMDNGQVYFGKLEQTQIGRASCRER